MLLILDYITSIKNRKVPLFYSVSLIVVVSLILSFISKIVEMKAPFHKKYCGEETLCPTVSILFVRFVHYITSLFFTLYYFIFNEKYDIYYLCLYVLLILHWLFANDCILSNWEMYFYNQKSTLGETGLLHPHLRVFVGDSTDYIIFFQIIVMTVGFVLVIHRFKTPYYGFLFGATVIILQMYMVLKDRIQIMRNWGNNVETKDKPVVVENEDQDK